jgi:hypothetical protein
MVLYAEGFSVSNYLVSVGGRQSFLKFVEMGLHGQWDQGVRTYYQMNSVEELEQAWLKNLHDTKDTGTLMAQAKPQANLLVRQTAPPAQPQLDPAGPVARGQSDDESRAPGTLTSRPAYLPDSSAATVTPLRVPPPPPMPITPQVPPVRLGVPEFGPPPSPPTPGVPQRPAVGQGN